MFTLYRRGKVFWYRDNKCGTETRKSLETRDRVVAEQLLRQLELSSRLGNIITQASKEYVPLNFGRNVRCRLHPEIAAFHVGLCRECYYDPARTDEKLSEEQIAELKKAALSQRLARYDMDFGAFILLLEHQMFKCAVCSLPLDDDICVDHEHGDGPMRVRGLLHRDCNIGLGAIETRGAVWTERALKYLGWKL